MTLPSVLTILSCLAIIVTGAENPHAWQSGMLLQTEKEQVHTGSTKTSNTDGTAKSKGNKTDYSDTKTTTTTDDYDTFQVYTIQGDKKTYVAKEKLLFPWSKPANVTVGEEVKFRVEKNKLYILDDDGKQHKAGLSKASMNAAQ